MPPSCHHHHTLRYRLEGQQFPFCLVKGVVLSFTSELNLLHCVLLGQLELVEALGQILAEITLNISGTRTLL